MNIGERIQDARKKNGLTQKELAKKLGLATGTIQQYELGKRQPRIKQLEAIADALDVHILDLIGVGSYFDKVRVIAHSPNGSSMDLGSVRDSYDQISPEEQREFLKLLREDLLDAYDRLNFSGQQKAWERVQELSEIPKYQRQPEERKQDAVDPQENDKDRS